MKNILLIQTAFIGDVILATALIESIAEKYPNAKIDVVLRKGNESLLVDNPKVNKLIVWNKRQNKYKNLKKVVKEIRTTSYDLLLNLQRFGSSGYMSWRSKADVKVGFDKNPFSFCYDHKISHQIGEGVHEIERNFELLKAVGDSNLKMPKLYPSDKHFSKVKALVKSENLRVLAPSSVWFTKQLPADKWVELIRLFDAKDQVVLIGAPADKDYLDKIRQSADRENTQNLAGELNLLESAALISLAKRTYVNDSAPLHLASAMNAPVTVFFCSTSPSFGFGPLSDESKIIETDEVLSCKPCGLHGKSECPLGHFQCGHTIEVTIS